MNHLRWQIANLFSPLISRLPSWYRFRVYSKIVGDPCRSHLASGIVDKELDPHGYSVELDRSDWIEAATSVTAQYYEVASTAVLRRLLCKGDGFLDIGGNLGLLTLTAASRVGVNGRVIYVEPNPDLVRRFAQTVVRNQLTHVEIVCKAVGAAPGEVYLDLAAHHGQSKVIEGIGTKVICGDALLDNFKDVSRLLVKIDTEGHEEQALKGMPRLRRRPNTVFLTEVTDEWLKEKSGGAASMFAMMKLDGFNAYLPELHRTGNLNFRLIKRPLDIYQYDVLFARPSEILTDR